MSRLKAAPRWDEDTPRTQYVPAIPRPMTAPSTAPPPVVVVVSSPPAPSCTIDGVPCDVARAAIVEPAWSIAERANTLRLRNSYDLRQLDRWLAERGLSAGSASPSG